jgi:poly(A) polymerase
VLRELEPLAERFDAAGFPVYLVGGAIRDLLLGSGASDDLDLTTPARPFDIKKLVTGWADAVWTQGERFGTIGVKRGDRVIEITTHRAEAYDPDSRKPTVTFGDDIDLDLSRRDFTINAMALRLGQAPVLVDPHGGAVDLATRVLRTPLGPEISFSDDPLHSSRCHLVCRSSPSSECATSSTS